MNQIYAAALLKQLDDGHSSDDEAAEAEAFCVIPRHLLKPLQACLGSTVRGMMGFRAIIRVGELRAEYCALQHQRGDSDILRQASIWIEEAEQKQRQSPLGAAMASLLLFSSVLETK